MKADIDWRETEAMAQRRSGAKNLVLSGLLASFSVFRAVQACLNAGIQKDITPPVRPDTQTGKAPS
nr:hypothetical protein [uncultured Roseibium sp.]